MNTFNKIKTIDSKFSWSFIGVIIGIAGLSYGIFVDNFKHEEPDLVFDVLSNTHVLDLKEDISDLKILYKSQNLKETKKTLVLLTIRISNEGNKEIKEVDYYSKVPFGIKIIGGQIAESPTLINASRDFFKEHVKLNYDTLNNILIEKIPIAKKEFFTIKTLIICDKDSTPSIFPFGELSGITEGMRIKNSYKENVKDDLNFWEKLTFGSSGMHVLRFFYYIFCIALVFAAIGLPLSGISSFFEKRKKKKLINKYKQTSKIEITENTEIIIEFFKEYNTPRIIWLDNVLNDKSKLNDYIIYMENRKKENLLINDYYTQRPKDSSYDEMRFGFFSSVNRVLGKLIGKNIIDIKNQNTVKENFLKELKEFRYFLELQ